MKNPLFGALRRDGVLSLGHHRFISATMIRIVVFWCKNNPVSRMLCYENVKSSDKFPATKFLFPNFLSLTLYKKSCFFG